MDISESSDAISALVEPLRCGLQELNLDLKADQQRRLLSYLALFEKWNKAYNLSAVRSLSQMLSRHLLDSLTIAPFIADDLGQRYIDVGTGGGLPGIPLAISFPEKHFTLLDSAGKKTRFLFQVKQSLSLDNVSIVNDRVENYHPEQRFDAVLSRAFASLEKMLPECSHLLTEGGQFWAMKGILPKDELSKVEKNYIVSQQYDLHVPGQEGERCLLVLKSH